MSVTNLMLKINQAKFEVKILGINTSSIALFWLACTLTHSFLMACVAGFRTFTPLESNDKKDLKAFKCTVVQ